MPTIARVQRNPSEEMEVEGIGLFSILDSRNVETERGLYKVFLLQMLEKPSSSPNISDTNEPFYFKVKGRDSDERLYRVQVSELELANGFATLSMSEKFKRGIQGERSYSHFENKEDALVHFNILLTNPRKGRIP